MSKRSDFPCPMIMRRSDKPIRSMLDGKVYTDTKSYERAVRSEGFEIAGNETAPLLAEPKSQAGIGVRDSIEQAKARLGV